MVNNGVETSEGSNGEEYRSGTTLSDRNCSSIPVNKAVSSEL